MADHESESAGPVFTVCDGEDVRHREPYSRKLALVGAAVIATAGNTKVVKLEYPAGLDSVELRTWVRNLTASIRHQGVTHGVRVRSRSVHDGLLLWAFSPKKAAKAERREP